MKNYNSRITEGSIDVLVKRKKIVQVGRVVVRSEDDKPFKVEPHLYGGNFDPGFYEINEDSYTIEFHCEDPELMSELDKRLPKGSYVSNFRKYREGWGGELYVEVPKHRLRRAKIRRVLGAGLIALGIVGSIAALDSHYGDSGLRAKVEEACNQSNIEQAHELRNSVYSKLSEYQVELGRSVDTNIGNPVLDVSLPNPEELTDNVNQYSRFVRENGLHRQIEACDQARIDLNEDMYSALGLMGSFTLMALGAFGGLARREKEKYWFK